MPDVFLKREKAIHNRIKRHYGKKLGRNITEEEAKEIAGNLLSFAKAIYRADGKKPA